LNERQINALKYLKKNARITNKVYQEINKTSSRTAVRDLKSLVKKGLLKQKGLKKGAFYEFSYGVNGA
jgi:ATP-dependent DNA helicase RecG